MQSIKYIQTRLYQVRLITRKSKNDDPVEFGFSPRGGVNLVTKMQLMAKLDVLPTAMTVATVDAFRQPSARSVS